uniref:Uncharacterized protein n=1 Tax=Romanomermis culicivorax TaxID=13658 RepID=A0A915HW87_ROMCU
MWALNISKLMLRFPAALRFFNNPATLFLQSDVLAYAALDAYYPLLLFLAFGHYGFVPKVYNAHALFPKDSLDATEMDHLAEMLIAAFHNIALTDILPADSADKIYPTIWQIALPVIMNGAHPFLNHQNIDAYDTSQASHSPESAQKEKEETKRRMEQVAGDIRR